MESPVQSLRANKINAAGTSDGKLRIVDSRTVMIGARRLKIYYFVSASLDCRLVNSSNLLSVPFWEIM